MSFNNLENPFDPSTVVYTVIVKLESRYKNDTYELISTKTALEFNNPVSKNVFELPYDQIKYNEHLSNTLYLHLKDGRKLKLHFGSANENAKHFSGFLKQKGVSTPKFATHTKIAILFAILYLSREAMKYFLK